MNYKIGSDKLDEVVRLFNDQVDPAANDDLVKAEICNVWSPSDGHQAWIDNASAQEIVDWLARFYS